MSVKEQVEKEYHQLILEHYKLTDRLEKVKDRISQLGAAIDMCAELEKEQVEEAGDGTV